MSIYVYITIQSQGILDPSLLASSRLASLSRFSPPSPRFFPAIRPEAAFSRDRGSYRPRRRDLPALSLSRALRSASQPSSRDLFSLLGLFRSRTLPISARPLSSTSWKRSLVRPRLYDSNTNALQYVLLELRFSTAVQFKDFFLLFFFFFRISYNSSAAFDHSGFKMDGW